MRVFVIIALFSIMNMVVLGVVHTTVSDEDDTVAVIFPPKYKIAQVLNAIAASDAVLVADGKWENIVIVHSDEAGLSSRLQENGALISINPKFARGCRLIR